MAFLNDNVLDNGLAWLVTYGTQLDICTAEPAVYADIATYTLGNKTSLSIGSPADRVGGGRKVTVAQFSDGTVTGTDTAAYWAISNGTNTLCAANALDTGQAVTSGNTFTLAAFDIGIPDPA